MRSKWLVVALVSSLSILSPLVARSHTNPFFNESSNTGSMPDLPNGFATFGGSTTDPGVVYAMQRMGQTNILARYPAVATSVSLDQGAFDVVGGLSAGGISPGAIAGIVVARTVDTSPSNSTDTGVFAYPLDGSPRIQLSNTNITDPTFAPATSANGNIVFKDLDGAAGTPVLLAQRAGGGVRLTINGAGFAQMGRPAINDSFDIALTGRPVGQPHSNLYFYPAGGSPITIPLSPGLELVGDQVSLTDDATKTRISYTALDTSTGQIGLYHSDKFKPQGINASRLIISGSTAEPLGGSFSTNDALVGTWLGRRGYLYYMAKSDLNSAGMQTNPLIVPGDGVDGSTVTDIRMSESSLLSNGDAMMFLTLADGRQGFYFVSVPEPTALLAAAALPLIARRRRVI